MLNSLVFSSFSLPGAGIPMLNHCTLLNQICCWQYKMENIQSTAEGGLFNNYILFHPSNNESFYKCSADFDVDSPAYTPLVIKLSIAHSVWCFFHCRTYFVFMAFDARLLYFPSVYYTSIYVSNLFI